MPILLIVARAFWKEAKKIKNKYVIIIKYMATGMLVNSVVCFAIFVASLLTSYSILNKKDKSRADISFAGFWFFTSIVWILMSISLVFCQRGMWQSDLLLNKYGVQTFIFAQIVAGSYYAFFRVFRNDRIAILGFFSYIILAAVALFSVYSKDGIVLSQKSFFSVEYRLNPVTWHIFQIIFSVGILCLLYDIIRLIAISVKAGKLKGAKYLFAGFSIILYGIFGYFDMQGITTQWTIVLYRIGVVAAAIIAYLAYNGGPIIEDFKEVFKAS